MRNERLHIYEFIYKLKNIAIFFAPFILNLGNFYFLSLAFSHLIFAIFFLLIYIEFKIYMSKNLLFSSEKIIFQTGIFTKKEISLKVKNINLVLIKQNIINKFFRTYKTFFIFHKNSHTFENGIHLTNKQVEKLKNLIKLDKTNLQYRITPPELVSLTISSNKLISSIILGFYLLKKWHKFSKLLCSYNSNLIIKNLSEIFFIINATLPVIILMFLLAFIFKILKFWNLSIAKCKDSLCISYGLFISSSYFLPLSSIRAISFKKSILNLILKNKLTYIHVPANAPNNKLLTGLKNIDHSFFYNELDLEKPIIKIKPDKNSIFSYIFLPIIIGLLVCFLSIFLPKHIKFFAISFSILISILHIYIRVLAFTKSNLALNSGFIQFCGYQGLCMLEGIISINHVKKLKIRQSIFQILSKRCSVYIYSSAHIKDCFKIRHLNVDNVENFVEILENLYINFKKHK